MVSGPGYKKVRTCAMKRRLLLSFQRDDPESEKEETCMSLKNLASWNDDAAISACGAACGASDKPAEAPAASGAGSACGAADKPAEEKPAACGSACGAGDK